MANTDTDQVYNFLRRRLSSNKYDIKYGSRSDGYLERDIALAKQGLSKIGVKEQEKIVNIIETFNNNQLSSVMENIRFNLEHHRDFSSLLRDTRDIQKGRFLKKPIGKSDPATCIETYVGFMRALKEDALYTAKLRIGGKLKRVFIKTPVGSSKTPDLDFGFSRLAIDPETLNVYSFVNHKDGRINEKKVKKVFSKRDLDSWVKVYHDEGRTIVAKESFLNFRKELLNKMDAVYGIERMINTYLRMGGKIDPKKYKNKKFKKEMIILLEEKFGTNKLLEWATKINNPKVVAKTKLEILETLGKYHGKEYRAHYSKEYNLNRAKTQRKTKPKIKPKIKRVFRRPV